MKALQYSMIGAMIFSLGARIHAAEIRLQISPSEVKITNESHCVVWDRTPQGSFDVTTQVRQGTRWAEMFEGRRPLVSGSLFDAKPTSYELVEDSDARKAVRFSGHQSSLGYDFDILVETNASQSLIQFTYTAHLPNGMTLTEPQPSIAFWSTHPPDVSLDQGPQSIYDKVGVPTTMGFPAAYVFMDRAECALFVNPTPSTWFRPDGVWRFLDARVATRESGGFWGLGLHTLKLSGNTIPAGDMVIELHVYAGPRTEPPTKLQALDTMIHALASLHPSDSDIPVDRLTGELPTWTSFARHAIADLSIPDVSLLTKTSTWIDEPARLVSPVPQVTRHPGRPGPIGQEQDGDFSCTNNHLTPWMLFGRASDDQAILGLARQKVNALPLYFDPEAGILRWCTRSTGQVGDLEMSWQNFFFNIEILRSDEATSDSDFNPAVVGRFLMGTRGLMDLARNVGYVFPQWFNPTSKQPAIQNDLPRLGTVREPWQVGSYAYLMMSAYQWTGDDRYLAECRASIETLLTRMTYVEENEVYTKTFADPAEFPITELFGNAYGAVASYRVYQETDDERFAEYARSFLNTLLRLTFWYEDDADPVCRDLRNAGLFYPHGGAQVTCPWETTEAYLAISWLIGNRRDPDLLPLLLRLSNLNRINSFYYYPAVYADRVAALEPERRRDISLYWPIEAFYGLEGNGGHRGDTAAYMAGNALWNWWMFEALAEPSDAEAMVLNTDTLDGYEAALSGVSRHFVAFNPSEHPKTFCLRSKTLPEGSYAVKIEPSSGKATQIDRSAEELRKGLDVSLAPGDFSFVALHRRGTGASDETIQRARDARRAMAMMYASIQTSASRGGSEAQIDSYRSQFQTALRLYRERHFETARDKANAVISALKGLEAP